MRILVCGGRKYNNRTHLFNILDAIHAKRGISLIISGAATGADSLAIEWATCRDVTFIGYPADWDKQGKAGVTVYEIK